MNLQNSITRKKILFTVSFVVLWVAITLVRYEYNHYIPKEAIVLSTLTTNIQSNTASFTFLTDVPIISQVELRDSSSDEVVTKQYEDTQYSFIDGTVRLNTEMVPQYTHHITFTNLQPGSEYTVAIASDETPSITFDESISLSDLSFTLPLTEIEPLQPDPAYGNVLDKFGNPIYDAIVFISLSDYEDHQKSNWGSAYVNSSGGWTYDMNQLTDETGAKVEIGKGDKEIITALTGPKYLPSNRFEVNPFMSKPVGDIRLNLSSGLEDFQLNLRNLFEGNPTSVNSENVLGVGNCSCDCTGTADHYCGQIGTQEQTIEGKCSLVEMHCNATYDSSAGKCNQNHLYSENPKVISNNPCSDTATPPANTQRIISESKWGGAGNYCVGNSLKYCSDEYTCPYTVKACETSCKINPVGRSDECQSQPVTTPPTTTPQVTDTPIVTSWGGAGAYCIDGKIQHCDTTSSCTRIIKDCGDAGCTPNPPGEPDECSKKQIDLTQVTISSENWGGAGAYCLDNDTLGNCTARDTCTIMKDCSEKCVYAKSGSSDYCSESKMDTGGTLRVGIVQEGTGLINPIAVAFKGRTCQSSPDCGGSGLVCNFNTCTDLSLLGYAYYSKEYESEYTIPTLTPYTPSPEKKKYAETSNYFYGMHPEVKDALDQALENEAVIAYLKECGDCKLFISSGYRSFETQQALRDKYCKEGQAASECGVAPAGLSQHAGGRAVDLYINQTTKDADGATVTKLLSIEPIRSQLIDAGLVHPIDWDTPHFFLPEKTYIPVENTNQQNLYSKVVSTVHAQAQNEPSDEAQPFSSFIDVIESGKYHFKSDIYEFGINDVEFYFDEGEAVRIAFFEDTNSNDTWDEGEPLIKPQKTIKLAKIETTAQYEIGEGWQTIAFTNFKKGTQLLASDFLQSVQNQGGQVNHIFTYADGKYYLFSMREDGSVYGKDFGLVPGKAYFIKSYKSITYQTTGNEIAQSLSLELTPGWNLVGIFNFGKDMTAQQVLTQMNSKGIPAHVLSRYEDSKYSSLIYTNGKYYGWDFAISSHSGYFVKLDGTENSEWTPE